jgi:Kef-type K+ transport system membrane component KefB
VSQRYPMGRLGLWVLLPLLPIVPIEALALNLPGACDDPASSAWRQIVPIVAVALCSLAVVAVAVQRLREVVPRDIPSSWAALATIAIVGVPLLLLLGQDVNFFLFVVNYTVFRYAVLLFGFSLLGILVAWLMRWRAEEIEMMLSMYLLCAGACLYPAQLWLTYLGRGAVLC